MHAPPSAATCCTLLPTIIMQHQSESRACNVARGMRRHSKDERNMKSLRAATGTHNCSSGSACVKYAQKKQGEGEQGAGRAGARQSIARVKALFKLCAAAWKRAFLAAWLMMIPDNRHLKDIYAATGVVFMLPVAAAAEAAAPTRSGQPQQLVEANKCQAKLPSLFWSARARVCWWWSSPLLLIIIIIKIIFIFSGAATPAATH